MGCGASASAKAAAPAATSVAVSEDAAENGHACLHEKIVADRAGWSAMNARVALPSEGAVFRFAMITDNDKATRVDDGSCWLAKLAFGHLTFSGGTYALSIESETTLKTLRGDDSRRGAEYSALELFDGKLIAMDDRTGNIDEIVVTPEGSREQYMVQPLVDADGAPVTILRGDGSKPKGLKNEWATQKAGKLVIGSSGSHAPTTLRL